MLGIGVLCRCGRNSELLDKSREAGGSSKVLLQRSLFCEKDKSIEASESSNVLLQRSLHCEKSSEKSVILSKES